MKTVILKNLYQGENSVKMMIRNGEKIYQQLTKFVFDVDKDSIEFPASGGTDTLIITANEPWTMTLPSWLTASAVSGRGSATITLTSQPTEETLEGDIVITCNGVQKTVSVTAGVHDYSKDYFTIEALEDGNLKVFFNTAFTLNYSVNGGEWVAISRTGGDDYNKTIPCLSGDIIQFKSTAANDIETRSGLFKDNTIKFSAYGNIMSLRYGDNYYGKTFHTGSWYSFQEMFNNSTGLQEANKIILPSNVVATCYSNMFQGCTSLTTAPELPATTLEGNCYSHMFDGCTSLTTAPELPANRLKAWCYAFMFQGCMSLNYIKCLATDISAGSCTYYWLSGVSPTGTFVKKAGVTWPTGNSGIPSGWTVIEE